MSTAKNTNSVGEIEPIANGRGASILGPRNPSIESANPDLLISPYTDAGTLPNLKFPFAQARNRVLTGGWAREVTARELPASQELAGVNMRLKPGGIREMHWHKEAEWAYMLAGSARITAVDPDGAQLRRRRRRGRPVVLSRGHRRTRSRDWRAGASSCSCSTTATSPRTRRS